MYRILSGFPIPEDIIFDGNTIKKGVRVNMGEDLILDALSKETLKDLCEKGLISKIDKEGNLIKKEVDPFAVESLTEGEVTKLITPRFLSKALELVTMSRYDLKTLENLLSKINNIMAQGIQNPVLVLLKEKLIEKRDIVLDLQIEEYRSSKK